jgi:hypothetical protein
MKLMMVSITMSGIFILLIVTTSTRNHLSLYQKGSYYMGIKLFNYLPLNLKKLYKDVKQFKLKLKEFLSHHSFYTLDEYIEHSSWKD